ncbi:MAG: M48 family metallopeptidase [Planctomycetes bacterium]|nr:M48 family metallopeptidase [Planctomycetota bacterium]
MRGPRTDFRSLQRQNRRRSFVLAFVLFLTMAALGTALGATWDNWLIGLLGGLVFAGVQYWIARAAGTRLVMMSAGARELLPGEDTQLWNVVHEAAIAAAMPPPKIWIIEESSPNAFATGFKTDEAHVAITTGLREKLDRAELQAVMAHELGHIKNGDTGFMVLMAVLVGSIAMLADLGLRSLWHGRGMNYSRGERGKSGAHVIAMVVVLVLAIIAPLFSRLLQAAVSREREYLADATSVELTRDPQALVNALHKLSLDTTPMRRANRATQHLWIVNPMRKLRGGGNALSTHPPLSKRIARIERLYA